jgi:hypothetical protein
LGARKDGFGLYGSKRDTALTATPQLSAPPLRQGKLRQAAKSRSLPLTQLRGFPSSRVKRVHLPSKNRHQSAPPPLRGAVKPPSLTADIAQITDSCASPGSVSVSEKGSGFVSAEAEAHYLDSTRTLRLTPPHLNPDVVSYLERHGETSVLAIMDMTR